MISTRLPTVSTPPIIAVVCIETMSPWGWIVVRPSLIWRGKRVHLNVHLWRSEKVWLLDPGSIQLAMADAEEWARRNGYALYLDH